ncbi:MAG TPA: Bax inhibitor-1/YccA family protein [Gammaproteobacteria bacterium]|nr:Bax inhibitor-1/YccA family protein [Gammaproteobacteria bacterium]
MSMIYGHSGLFIVAIAAFNLILDFDMLSKQATAGAPRYIDGMKPSP